MGDGIDRIPENFQAFQKHSTEIHTSQSKKGLPFSLHGRTWATSPTFAVSLPYSFARMMGDGIDGIPKNFQAVQKHSTKIHIWKSKYCVPFSLPCRTWTTSPTFAVRLPYSYGHARVMGDGWRGGVETAMVAQGYFQQLSEAGHLSLAGLLTTWG